MLKIKQLAVFALLILLPYNAQAEFELLFPVDCKLGEDCLTVSYVDVDPSENYADFTCTNKSYDGHKGVDFALQSRLTMKEGVNVLAAADGKILRNRNSETDSIKKEDEYQAIRKSNKDCGNGVLMEHADGYQTFYCHLKQNSILVKPGDTVKAGDPIGQVGQSGFSEFPHLHFTVFKDKKHIDPFTQEKIDSGCGKAFKSLWKDKSIQYEPFALYDGGFTTEIPDFSELRKQEYAHPSFIEQTPENFIYWVGFYYAKKGDNLRMEIKTPSGQLLESRDIVLEKNRKRPTYYYIGKKMRGRTLPPGTYQGITTFTRLQNGAVRHKKTYTHTIKVQ